MRCFLVIGQFLKVFDKLSLRATPKASEAISGIASSLMLLAMTWWLPKAQWLRWTFFFVFLAGCASSSQIAGKGVRPQAPGESRQDVVSAMEHVLGVVGGKPVDQKGLENLGREIQKDPEAKSAVKAITDSMSGQDHTVKYCPIDGERYSPKFKFCPVHKVLLKSLGD